MHRRDAVGGARRLGMRCESLDSIPVENVGEIEVIERLTCSDGHPHPSLFSCNKAAGFDEVSSPAANKSCPVGP